MWNDFLHVFILSCKRLAQRWAHFALPCGSFTGLKPLIVAAHAESKTRGGIRRLTDHPVRRLTDSSALPSLSGAQGCFEPGWFEQQVESVRGAVDKNVRIHDCFERATLAVLNCNRQ